VSLFFTEIIKHSFASEGAQSAIKSLDILDKKGSFFTLKLCQFKNHVEIIPKI
jgi:hypothetical protein